MENPRDISADYLRTNSDLEKVERPIPYREFLHHSKARDKRLEYKILKKITETKIHAEYLMDSPENNIHNRYHDILPYRDTAVNLSGGQYINANKILVSDSTAQRIIATQGPMSNTCAVFWRMVWEEEVSLIVMCCGFIENEVPKCYEYFSDLGSVQFEEFEVLVVKEVSQLTQATKKSILLTNINTRQTKKITHLHLNNWEDNSVPPIKEYFNVINYAIFMIQHKLRKHAGKIIVHCSAGIGRTGVVIGLYELISKLETELVDAQNPSISVFGTVRKLREQRWGMVTTEEQYEFMYRFLDYWIAAYIYTNENETAQTEPVVTEKNLVSE